MIELKNISASEVDTFLPDVPQDVIGRNIEDPILRMIACQGVLFIKNTVQMAAKGFGVKMKRAAEWIDPRQADGVVQSYSFYSANANAYSVDLRWWLELMRVMSVKECGEMQKYSLNDSVMGKANVVTLSGMVNAYLHGTLRPEMLKEWTRKITYIESSSILAKCLCHMSGYEVLHPLLLSLGARSKEIVLRDLCEKLCNWTISDVEMSAILAIAEEPDISISREDKRGVRRCIAYYNDFLKCGDIQKAKNRLLDDSYMGNVFDALSFMQSGDYNKAVKFFNAALKDAGAKHFFIYGLDYYYGLALVYSTAVSAKNKLKSLASNYDLMRELWSGRSACFYAILSKETRLNVDVDGLLDKMDHGSILYKAFVLLVLQHYQMLRKEDNSRINPVLDNIDELGLKALQLDVSIAFGRNEDKVEDLMKATGMHPFLQPYEAKPVWESVLDELMLLNGVSASGKKTAKKKAVQMSRIAYYVNLNGMVVQPKLQKSKDGIIWSAGRNIALKRFRIGDVEDMTPQDLSVAECVVDDSYGWYAATSYELRGNEVMAALVGHPYVYEEGTDMHLDVVEEKMQLSVKTWGGKFSFSSSFNMSKKSDGYVVDIKQKPIIRVVKIDTKIADTIDTLKSIAVPVEAKDKLTRLLEGLSDKVVVMSDLLKDSENLKEVPSHSEIVVRFKPDGELINCFVGVRPFGDVPPMCKPGKGMEVITATVNGEMVRTTRDLKKEAQHYDDVLHMMNDYDGDGVESWALDMEECLQVLDQLRNMTDSCIVEWPEGERFRVSYAPIRPEMMKLSVRSLASWFEMSGEICVSDDVKLKMAELMERLKESKGNFICLKDDDYVRVSDDLRKYLNSINRVAAVSKDKVKLAAFNAVQLEGLEDAGIDIDADEAFKTLMRRIEEANDVKCRVPKNIQADLRSYQKEGYEWMTRLAHWGAGALLADDMGLGKTVQTVAMLLSRASMGAQLVVVPTSLILNWQSELMRFAPSLSVVILNRQGCDRAKMLSEVKAFDIVITTYGLLVTEEENITSRHWTTVVLDEAHTIKNKETKMSKAAMKLDADFRLLLTGTPLQNHVSEMWNLMQFANPGLLGSFQQFGDRFLLPIERDHDKEAQRVLRRVISPFILRRTKSDVLSELPEKTEITIKVDLSEEEMAFYQNIREQALANLADSSSTAMQALAEITRLRQAACNTRLVNSKVDLPSSKLESFMSLVQNLHDNHHRALVFSQFTTHLALVRERLDKEGVQYLYLDGSMSARERIRLVEEFQHGEMPLFLISLKAGGTGLNLTAADYVIHLDPWWNPAIEEQASDRAYRIGQKKPVTIYRIIAAGTIEENILNLHAQKRNMADALLEGGDVSASMSRDEMISLLKENSMML